MYLYATNMVNTPNLKYADSSTKYCVIMMLQNLKKVSKWKIFNFFLILRHEVPFKANNNREAVVVCANHVVKRPSKRSVLVIIQGWVQVQLYLSTLVLKYNFVSTCTCT